VTSLIVLALFFVAPFALGMRTRSNWSLVFPAVLFALAVWGYATFDQPPEGQGDEVDVIPGVMVIFSTAAIVLCFVGVLVGRRLDTPRD
jgi:hypothetical protein